MTAPKGTFRRRRQTTLMSIPRPIAEWFAGTRNFTFYAYSYPYRAHMREYWSAWLVEHPDAIMPKGLDYMLKTPAYPRGYKL